MLVSKYRKHKSLVQALDIDGMIDFLDVSNDPKTIASFGAYLRNSSALLYHKIKVCKRPVGVRVIRVGSWNGKDSFGINSVKRYNRAGEVVIEKAVRVDRARPVENDNFGEDIIQRIIAKNHRDLNVHRASIGLPPWEFSATKMTKRLGDVCKCVADDVGGFIRTVMGSQIFCIYCRKQWTQDAIKSYRQKFGGPRLLKTLARMAAAAGA